MGFKPSSQFYSSHGENYKATYALPGKQGNMLCYFLSNSSNCKRINLYIYLYLCFFFFSYFSYMVAWFLRFAITTWWHQPFPQHVWCKLDIHSTDIQRNISYRFQHMETTNLQHVKNWVPKHSGLDRYGTKWCFKLSFWAFLRINLEQIFNTEMKRASFAILNKFLKRILH